MGDNSELKVLAEKLINDYKHPKLFRKNKSWDAEFKAQWYVDCLTFCDLLDGVPRMTNRKESLVKLVEKEGDDRTEEDRDQIYQLINAIQQSFSFTP